MRSEIDLKRAVRAHIGFPYLGEVMTGFEYVAAAEMIFQGYDNEALTVFHSNISTYRKRSSLQSSADSLNISRGLLSCISKYMRPVTVTSYLNTSVLPVRCDLNTTSA